MEICLGRKSSYTLTKNEQAFEEKNGYIVLQECDASHYRKNIVLQRSDLKRDKMPYGKHGSNQRFWRPVLLHEDMQNIKLGGNDGP